MSFDPNIPAAHVTSARADSVSRFGPPILPRLPETYQSDISDFPGPSRSAQINRRSCNECGRRKIRCDRYHPCDNCTKAGAECVFPVSRRRPDRQGKRIQTRDEDLHRSLRRLERRLQYTEDAVEGRDSRVARRQDAESHLHSHEDTGITQRKPPQPTTDTIQNKPALSEQSPHLMLDHDRSRYISNSFWASLSREIDEMRDILDGSSSEGEEDASPQDQDTPASTSRLSLHTRDSFIFGPNATSQALQSLYPSPTDLLTMFDIFLENVDPVARVFYRPALRTTVTEALALLPGALDRHTEVVILSVCYAALTSLDETGCRELFDEERRVLLSRYRYAVEQTLARARFLDSRNLTVLAALVLFLLCVRRHDDSQFVSSLLGIALRNARAMGLHRDGTKFHLSPYETETRRRLWWHICVLDIRASEDHGCDPSIYEQDYDTKFPLNINDEDISPSDIVAPAERTAGSDMAFCLLRFEVSVAVRKLSYPAPIGSREPGMSHSEKRAYVEDMEKHFHTKYINHCDITKPFDWVTASWARLMLAKLWLAVSNPLTERIDKVASGPEDGNGPDDMLSRSRSLAFEKSVEVLELSDQLETGHRAARWRWLFLTHVQWHAVVFVLAYLCVRPSDQLSSRAWRVIDRVCERWPTDGRENRGMLWKPIRRLLDRAHQIRSNSSAGFTRRSATFGQDKGQFDPSTIRSMDDWQTRISSQGGHGIPQMTDEATTTSWGVLGSREDEISTGGPYGDKEKLLAGQVGTVAGASSSRQPDQGFELGVNGAGNVSDQGTYISDWNDTLGNLTAGGSFSHQLDQDFEIAATGAGNISNPGTFTSDWNDTLHELQLVFQEGRDINTMDGYYGSLWSTL